MTDLSLIEQERRLLGELARLAAERAEGEAKVEQTFLARHQATAAEFQGVQQGIQARFEADKAAVEREFQETREQLRTRYATELSEQERAYHEARQRIAAQFRAGNESASKELEEARWMAAAVYEANKNEAKEQWAGARRFGAEAAQRGKLVRREATRLLNRWRLLHLFGSCGSLDAGQPSEAVEPRQLDERIALAESQLVQLRALRLPRLLQGNRLRWLLALGWVVVVGAVAWQFRSLTAITGTALAAALLAGGAYAWLLVASRNNVRAIIRPLFEAAFDIKALRRQWERQASAEYRRRSQEHKERLDADQRRADEKCQERIRETNRVRDEQMSAVEQTYPRRLDELRQSRTQALGQIEETYPTQLAQIEQRLTHDLVELGQRREQALAEILASRDRQWETMAQRWREGLEQIAAQVAELGRRTEQLFPAWSEAHWESWQPAGLVPPVLCIGRFQVRLEQIPQGIPDDERLRHPELQCFSLPGLLPFPQCSSILFQARDRGKALAEQAIQALMMRLVTTLPPGKVRFTIIDPAGLGQSFSTFMHLADHDETLVASRIWTEIPHIEERLADLTAHMENVFQKYLRNLFPTIEDYNAHAGEVAEPYRFLVVANFPVNFSEAAARRLLSIISSGPRCGVYTLLSLDAAHPLPHGLHREELEQLCATLLWNDRRFVWKKPHFERFPLELETPPPPDLAARLLQVVGERAKEAMRVEVPFEFIAPPPEAWWTSDSRPGIQVALGRAGAKKRQHLKLGQGTSQHVLIAGKTGAGKSTLLHALITNLALLYSPRELQLYLVDFKKGVEFKTYATHELPHARVVAIESEREFGLSVMQSLDTELKRRGALFRALGVNDLVTYRQANGSDRLPRILLIVDEFQEFFVEDDKIAQEAALLLDRLVRQGRAFGIHVLLGSQTLGGAYTLARSTIGQMAVRIALQCSESDAHLILSDDNTAARLLGRPGEAIYNDANGRIEGNNPFQVVWLADDRREHYLERIRQLARERSMQPMEPQIVFEGNSPADIARNQPLNQWLAAPGYAAPPAAPNAWMGEAIAIKDPTAAPFPRQAGSNLLLVGQQGDTARGAMAAALLSLIAQYPPAESAATLPAAEFYVLDGCRADDPHAGFLRRLVARLPHRIQFGNWRDAPEIVARLATELERRQEQGTGSDSRVFLFVYDLQRFRELRRMEDDFSFSRTGEERAASAAEQLAAIVRDGPDLGMHTLIWCDTLNSANRSLDRQSLREFEMRVLFQMSAADSSSLIDTPVASKLGLHRALYSSEERGQLEKFRPYGLPSPEWLDWLSEQVQRKSRS